MTRRSQNNYSKSAITKSVWRRVPAKWRIVVVVAACAFVFIAKVCSQNHSVVAVGRHTSSSGIYGPQSEMLLDVKLDPKMCDLPMEELSYAGMEVSFNTDLHIPNWVAWELTADETNGAVARQNRFVADPTVAASASPDDYRNSGFDRGHMAPAGDMKWSREAMDETFYMTNICPQSKSLNTGAWKKLEEKSRQWARRDSAIVIVCGPVVADHLTQRIGATGVAVPKRFFKVILAPYAIPPRGIGFVMDNGAIDGGMQQTAMSIDDVERITGFDFFHALPDDIETVVESQNDFHSWSTAK